MRNSLLLALCLITGLLSAQTVDSVALRRVDSLIQVSRTLTDQRNFDKAVTLALEAKAIREKALGKDHPLLPQP